MNQPESRYGEALGIASRIVSRLDTGSYNSVPDKDVKVLADAVILMHSALSETGPSEDAERFRWLLPYLRVDWQGHYGELGIVESLPDFSVETADVREAIDSLRLGERG